MIEYKTAYKVLRERIIYGKISEETARKIYTVGNLPKEELDELLKLKKFNIELNVTLDRILGEKRTD